MTLTYELDLDIPKMNFLGKAFKIYSITDRQTHTQTDATENITIRRIRGYL